MTDYANPRPTQNAVAGKFQSTNGDDLVQYLNPEGQVVFWIDATGAMFFNPNGDFSSVSWSNRSATS
jgi:hypothetical protein